MQYKGEKYYSLMNVVRTTTSTTYTHTEDRNPLWHYLAADYDGVDGFYLSGVLRAISGDTSYLILSTVGGTDVTSSEISTTSTVNVVIRSGDILADLTDATDYRARWKKSGTAGTSAFDRAMVVCAQTNPTKLVTVIELAEDNNVPSTSYAAPSDYAIYLHTAARFDGTVVYYLEVDLHPNSSGDNVYGALYDITGAAQVSSSEVSHTGNTTTTRKISSAITLVDGREYRPDIKGDSTSDDVNGVKLIIKQTGTPTKTDNYIGILNTASSGTGASYAYQNRLYEWDDTAWEGDSVVAKYEPTLKSSSGELAYYNLYNDTDAAELAVASTTSATYVRVRDDTVTMPSDDNNILNSGRKIDTSGTVSVARAFLIIQIDWSSGSNYTKNLSDTINTSSSIIRAVTKLISLNLNLAVVLQKATSTERSSTLNTTSSVLRLPGKLFSNPLNLSSVFARVSTLLRTLTESLNISSGLQKAISSTKSEGVNLESQLTQVDIVGKFFVETVNMSSSLIKSVSRALQEVANLASSIVTELLSFDSQAITIKAGYVSGSSDLTDFPVLLTNCHFLAHAFDNSIDGGDDLRFYSDSAGTVPLAFEIVKWDTTDDEAEIWVKIPTLSASDDTVIFVRYNDPGASPLPRDDTYGSDNVWRSEYKAVYHLEGDFIDSTVNANDLTGVNSPVGAAGQIGQGMEFEASSSMYAGIADASQTGLDLSGDFALETFFELESLPASGGNLVAKYATSGNRGYRLRVLSDGRLELTVNETSDDTTRDVYSWSVGITTATPYHVVVLCDISNSSATQFELILNGVSQGNGTAFVSGNSASIYNNAVDFTIAANLNGASDTPTDFLDGVMDETRVYAGLYSVDWAKTVFANQSDPCAFAVSGSIYYGNFTESLNAVDNIVRIVGKVMASTLQMTSSIMRAASKLLIEAVNATSVFLVAPVYGKTLTDSILHSDTVTTVRVYLKDLSDTVAVVSSLLYSLSKSLVDTLSSASVFLLLRSFSKGLTLIYNILSFIIGIRVKPTILRVEGDGPEVVGALGDGPEVVNISGDSPTILSAKDE